MMAESIAKTVYAFTARKLYEILHQQNDSMQKASLANLRRGVGRKPGELPEIWGELLESMPESLMNPLGEPSKAEWAVYTAITLFAVHQQGHDVKNEPMHVENVRFGTAVARLVETDDDRTRITNRFNMAATATEMTELSHHMRGLITLMRGMAIPFDYASLAEDIYHYQFEEARARVRLRWGQDFYKELNKGREEDKDE